MVSGKAGLDLDFAILVHDTVSVTLNGTAVTDDDFLEVLFHDLPCVSVRCHALEPVDKAVLDELAFAAEYVLHDSLTVAGLCDGSPVKLHWNEISKNFLQFMAELLLRVFQVLLQFQQFHV